MRGASYRRETVELGATTLIGAGAGWLVSRLDAPSVWQRVGPVPTMIVGGISGLIVGIVWTVRAAGARWDETTPLHHRREKMSQAGRPLGSALWRRRNRWHELRLFAGTGALLYLIYRLADRWVL